MELIKLSQTERKAKIKEFIAFWTNKGYEKGESQSFWLALLNQVLGVEEPEKVIVFEKQVSADNTSFIDGYIKETRVLIEQKSNTKKLNELIKQSDGTFLTPFQQAKRYAMNLPLSQMPRWIITCNFEEFYIYDMEKPNSEPEIVLLKDLVKDSYRLQFIVNIKDDNIKKEQEVSLQAGVLVGKIYDLLKAQYHDIETSVEEQRSLNILCVRLVFCLYAEDSGIFTRNQFSDYLNSFRTDNTREALQNLFKMLDTKIENRETYENPKLLAFPYVNGGLFSDESITIPQINDNIKSTLVLTASKGFDWSGISPTIFGAVFESTLNQETRRAGGMHYTSIENIHKVIDPLFLNDLWEEFESIKSIAVERTRDTKLKEFQNKLASLTFLDPACGSGNFLTETYLSLRKLENEVIKLLVGNQIAMGLTGEYNPIKVSIYQFYGIEINDFAVDVAKTALWISEYQMLQKTDEIVHSDLNFLPLKTYDNIKKGNALTIDWESVIPKQKLNYIMGNPPFVGAMYMTREQKNELTTLFGNIKGIGELDYVSGWYLKASEFIYNTRIKVAFVSTNSICQGQQAVLLWKPLFERKINIFFAYKTFIWDSESTSKAHVHCIIVGFMYNIPQKRTIYDNELVKNVLQINSYLCDAPIVFVDSITEPLCNVPPIRFGSMPRDDGGFILSSEEKKQFEKENPISTKWIKKYLGAYEFLNNKERYCLWLLGANPHEIKHCPKVLERIEHVRQFRANSIAEATRKFAQTPTVFCQIAQPNSDYIAIPKTSSAKRRYIPMGFLNKDIIASDLLFLIPNATLFHFGVLMSSVHNAWMRVVCGRLKSDYRYAKDIVYNNFPWCNPTEEQKAKIEQTAQAILDARALYKDCSLSDLYDETIMPPELRKAHQQNNIAVMQAYGFLDKVHSESECVAELMKMYQKLVENKNCK